MRGFFIYETHFRDYLVVDYLVMLLCLLDNGEPVTADCDVGGSRSGLSLDLNRSIRILAHLASADLVFRGGGCLGDIPGDDEVLSILSGRGLGLKGRDFLNINVLDLVAAHGRSVEAHCRDPRKCTEKHFGKIGQWPLVM